MKLKIGGKIFTKFTKYNITDNYNALGGTFSVNGIENPRQYIYQSCAFYNDDGELILNGTITDINNDENPTPEESVISGYGEAGIFEDVSIFLASYPMERKNMNLEDLIRIFMGEVYDSAGYAVHESDYDSSLEPFSKVVANSTQSPKDFITKLALQRGLFLSHLPNGLVLLIGKPLEAAKFYDIERYIENFKDRIAGRGIHSHINIELQSDSTNDGKIYTLENPFVTQRREITVQMRDGEVKDMPDFAKKIKSSEMQNVKASFSSIKFVPIGNLIQKDDQQWFITQVTISGDAAGETYSYSAVVKEAYE